MTTVACERTDVGLRIVVVGDGAALQDADGIGGAVVAVLLREGVRHLVLVAVREALFEAHEQRLVGPLADRIRRDDLSPLRQRPNAVLRRVDVLGREVVGGFLIDAVYVQCRIGHHLLGEAGAVGVDGSVHQLVVQDVDVRRRRRGECCRVASLVWIGITRVVDDDAVLLQRCDFGALRCVGHGGEHQSVAGTDDETPVVPDVPGHTCPRPDVVLVAPCAEVDVGQRTRILRLRVILVPDSRLDVISHAQVECHSG